MVASTKVASARGFRGQEREPHSGCLESEADGEVGMLLYLQRAGNPVFHGPAKVVRQAGGDISHPGGDDFPRAARDDDLVQLDVRYRRDQGEIAFLLADDFVAGGERYERFQPASHGHGHAVLNVSRDSFGQAAHFIHSFSLYLLAPLSSSSGAELARPMDNAL